MSVLDPFKVPVTQILGATSIGLLIAAAGLGLVARVEHERAERWQLQAGVEAKNHRQTKADYAAAQALAAEKARATRIATEQRYAALAKDADDANQDAADWRAAAHRYADAGGLPVGPRSAAGGEGGGAGTGATVVAAPGTDGRGEAPVVLSRADFDVLTENTERLIRAHAWGEQLIDEGLAERLP